MSSERLLILHFILDGISPIGSPSHILAEYMRGFMDASRFYFEEIVFDFSNDILKNGLEKKLQILCQSHK
jgi:hypothetical protein